MKNRILIFVAILFGAFNLMSQSSKGFSFQGYARGADGSALQNETNLEVKFTIYSTDVNNPEFSESQTLSTDEFGVFQAVIGSVSSNAFNLLVFSDKDYSLKVEVKDGGSYQQVANQTLLAVPYAKGAEKAVEAISAANGCPPGSIMPFAGTVIPEGWVLCDGSALSRTEYAKLYAAIGLAWGAGDNATTFNLPDFRGQFLRGVAGTTDVDPDRDGRTSKYSGGNTGNKVGSYQETMFSSHNHAASSAVSGVHTHDYWEYYWRDTGNDSQYSTGAGDDVGERIATYRTTSQGGSHNHSISVNNNGGYENRPKNAYVNYIIKL